MVQEEQQVHIILVSNRLATARTFVITPRSVLLAIAVLAAIVFAMSAFFSWLSVQYRLPFLEHLVLSVHKKESDKTDAHLRSNLDAMAARLGEMQAQLLQLDSLSERVSSLAGIKAPEAKAGSRSGTSIEDPFKGVRPLERSLGQPSDRQFDLRAGQGGPLLLAQPRTTDEFDQALARLGQHLAARSDTLEALEAVLLDQQVRRALLPTITPIQAGYIGSGFGWRLDPFVGAGSMHEGIDFVADIGTPVVAAAGGVIVSAERHPAYGNLIEIDHGNDFTTRYAHLSKMTVREGQVVKRGQNVGLSGNTGRSTGPHLHFEVRFRGVAQNPARFLQQGEQFAQLPQRRK